MIKTKKKVFLIAVFLILAVFGVNAFVVRITDVFSTFNKINTTFITFDGNANLSKTDLNTTNIYAENIYKSGTELNNFYIKISDLPLENKTKIHCSNITGASSDLCTVAGGITYYGSSNISIDGSNRIWFNMTCEQITGGSGLCDGIDDTGTGADWSKIQNWTDSSIECGVGQVVKGRYQNGTFKCVVDTDTTIGNCSISGSCDDILYEGELDSETELENQIGGINLITNNELNTKLDNKTVIRNHNVSWILNNQNYNTTKDIINAINHTDLLFSFKVLWANIENKITKLSELTNDLDFYSGSQVNSSIAEHNKSIKVYIDTQDSLQDECSEITGCIVKTTITGWIDNNKTDILNTLRNDIDSNASYLKSYANSINTSTNLQELGFNTTQQLENYFNTLFMSFFDLSDYWNMSKEKLGINNLTACAEGQVLKYVSGSWTCGTDQTGGGGGTGLWDKYPDGWHRLNQSRTTGEDIDVNKINSTEINVSETIITHNISISSGLLQTTPVNDSDIKSLVNKEYVDFAVTSLGATYYMYDEDDATGYKTCYLNPSSDAETYIEASGLADDDYIGGWISGVGEAPSKLLKGVYDWYITLEKTGTKTLRVYWKLIERKSNDDEVVIATSSNSNEINGKAAYLVPLQLNEDYIPDSGSRIVGKLYADVSGGGSSPTVRLYYQGSTSSRWEIPANTEIFKTIFVPYDGAVKDVDLGSKNLNTTGTIDGGAVKVSGVDVLTSDMDTEAELETQIGGINLITSTELSDKLDNTTIIREHNTSWITKNQNYNTTKDIQNAVNNSGYYNIEVSDLSCSGCLAIGTEVVDTGGLADGDDDTTYSASGTLLDLTGTTFSVKEGTLTTGKLCSFDGTNLVCNSDDDDTPDGDSEVPDDITIDTTKELKVNKKVNITTAGRIKMSDENITGVDCIVFSSGGMICSLT